MAVAESILKETGRRAGGGTGKKVPLFQFTMEWALGTLFWGA